jgi:hypothetical protein
MDIVVPVEGKATGYLASSKEEYAGAIHSILSLGESERIALQVGHDGCHWTCAMLIH